MEVKYLKLNSFEDLEAFKTAYETKNPKVSWQEFPSILFSKKPYVYSYFYSIPEKYQEKVINIPFLIKNIGDDIYVLYNDSSAEERHVKKFKRKLESLSFDPNNFENLSNEDIANKYLSGYYEIII